MLLWVSMVVKLYSMLELFNGLNNLYNLLNMLDLQSSLFLCQYFVLVEPMYTMYIYVMYSQFQLDHEWYIHHERATCPKGLDCPASKSSVTRLVGTGFTSHSRQSLKHPSHQSQD